MNRGLLPDDYYALPEQVAAGFGPDVLTLQGRSGAQPEHSWNDGSGGTAAALLSPPRTRFTAETGQ